VLSIAVASTPQHADALAHELVEVDLLQRVEDFPARFGSPDRTTGSWAI
jgi:hypothetical protein